MESVKSFNGSFSHMVHFFYFCFFLRKSLPSFVRLGKVR